MQDTAMRDDNNFWVCCVVLALRLVFFAVLASVIIAVSASVIILLYFFWPSLLWGSLIAGLAVNLMRSRWPLLGSFIVLCTLMAIAFFFGALPTLGLSILIALSCGLACMVRYKKSVEDSLRFSSIIRQIFLYGFFNIVGLIFIVVSILTIIPILAATPVLAVTSAAFWPIAVSSIIVSLAFSLLGAEKNTNAVAAVINIIIGVAMLGAFILVLPLIPEIATLSVSVISVLKLLYILPIFTYGSSYAITGTLLLFNLCSGGDKGLGTVATGVFSSSSPSTDVKQSMMGSHERCHSSTFSADLLSFQQ